MKRSKTLARHRSRQPHALGQRLYRSLVRGLGRHGFGLSLLGIAAAGGAAQPVPAQDRPLSRRLTVRPQEMATGTRTERAGEYQLAPPVVEGALVSLGSSVYVPQQCVGTRRCPLVVFVWTPWRETMRWVQPMADKYGMILLGPGILYNNLSGWGGLSGVDASAFAQERQHLDATLKQVLQQFAIHPDKIAIMGTCGTGHVPVNIGGENFHVFSRIVSLSGAPSPNTIQRMDLPTPTTEFLFDAGINESRKYFRVAQQMRHKGYRVTHAIGFRWHGHTLESYDYVGRWLQQTWASPDPDARPAPSVLADPLPELTVDVLARMTAFWTAFVTLPDSIRMVARRAHPREVIVPVGEARPVVTMVDMAVLATRYPAVAAALKMAGLTAQQHDAYRVALASARAIKMNGGEAAIGTLDPASVMAKNVAFMEAHPDDFQALERITQGYVRNDNNVHVAASMWTMP